MKTCTKCKKKLGFFDKIFCGGLCTPCKSKEIEIGRKEEERKEKIKERKREEIHKVKEKLKKFEDEDLGLLNYQNLEYTGSDLGDFDEDYGNYEGTKINHKKDKKEIYSISIKELYQRVIKNNFNVEKTLEEIEEEIEYKLQVDKLKEKERKRKIRENAEKDFYGRIKSKRDNLSLDKRKDILRRFNNKCVICDREEGLHIHHKDNNPKNNLPENLIVLCGVCHKKAHMKVR